MALAHVTRANKANAKSGHGLFSLNYYDEINTFDCFFLYGNRDADLPRPSFM
ncbi:hypothetical protein AT5A_15966 [Agrobacterium tumefaciens 5A]|nr:hypothetical protein AT5A_15966 [Agrobacterium tumefaciens 5A]